MRLRSLLLGLLLVDAASVHAMSPFERCQLRLLGRVVWSSKATTTPPVPPAIDSLEKLFWAFSHGLVPDFGNDDHRKAFLAYMRHQYGPLSRRQLQSTDLLDLENQYRQRPQVFRAPLLPSVEMTLARRDALRPDGSLVEISERVLESARALAAQAEAPAADQALSRAVLEDPQALKDLESDIAHVRWAALRRIAATRARLNSQLGVALDAPVRGLRHPRELDEFVANFHFQGRDQGVETGDLVALTVRNLSVAEAANRDCLTECLPLESFETGMDPGYRFFTLTNARNLSTGFIELALRDLPTGRKVAIIDRIHSIPEALIEPMLEAVRRSLLTRNIELRLPLALVPKRDHPDDRSVAAFLSLIAQRIQREGAATEVFELRAGTVLPRRVTTLAYRARADLNVRYDLEPEITPWTVARIDFKSLITDAFALRDGSDIDRRRYVRMAELLEFSGIISHQENLALFQRWLSGCDQHSFELRLDVFRVLLSTGDATAMAQALSFYPAHERAEMWARLSGEVKGNLKAHLYLLLAEGSERSLSELYSKLTLDQSLASLNAFARMFPEEGRWVRLAPPLFAGLPASIREGLARAFAAAKGSLEGIRNYLSDPSVPLEDRASFGEFFFAREKTGQLVDDLLDYAGSERGALGAVWKKNAPMQTALEQYRRERAKDRPTCFAAGTRVRMADGTRRRIETLRVGHRVLTLNLVTGRMEAERITQLEQKWSQRVQVLKFAKGRALRVTSEHPIFSLTRNAYVRAADLRLGEMVMRWERGVAKAVLLKDRIHLKPRRRVYNFETGSNHNYWAEDVLVHNMGIKISM